MGLGRNEKLRISCEYEGREPNCPKQCDECAIAMKKSGDIALSTNRLNDSIKLYKKALFVEPNYSEAWCNLATVYRMKSEYNNSLSAFNKALEIDPLFGEAMYGKAITLEKMGKLLAAYALVNDILILYDEPMVKNLKTRLEKIGIRNTQRDNSLQKKEKKISSILSMLFSTKYHDQEKKEKNRASLNMALEKLAMSTKEYNYEPPDSSAMCYTMVPLEYIPFKFRCARCGKRTSIEVIDDNGEEQQIVLRYRALADKFTELGFRAVVRCYCDKCADRYYPSDDKFRHHNFVFSVSRPDCAKPINSFPSTRSYDDFKYKIALAFLRGAETIPKLSAATNSKLSAETYLDCVHSVLGTVVK